MNLENLSLTVRQAIHILFIANPRGTSIGILIGVVLDGILGLFSPSLKAIQAINISAIKMWHLVALSIAGINIPSYLRRKKIDPSISSAMDFIEESKAKDNLPEWQVRQMYTDLYQKVLDNMSLDAENEKTIDILNSIVNVQNKDGE